MRGSLSRYLVLALVICFVPACRKAEFAHSAKKLDFAKASGAHDDDAGYVDGEEELEEFAKQDWQHVEPILKRMAAVPQSRTATLAQTLLYQHLVHTSNATAVADLREGLRKTAENRRALGYCRAKATEALLSSNWDGRDEWYLSLFKDDSIRYLHDGSQLHIPLLYPVAGNPEHWIPIMAKLLDNTDLAVHNSAVACLVQFNLKYARRDALIPLLPWLLDRNWSSAGDRLRLIQSTAQLDLKSSVPGLIAVLGEEGNSSERAYAAEALAHFKNPRAVPALRRALLEEPEAANRSRVIQGLVACGGVSAKEAGDSVEAYLRLVSREEGRKQFESYQSVNGAKVPEDVSLGNWIANQGPADEATVQILAQRATQLRASDPELAGAIQKTIAGWPSEGAGRETVREIRAGSATSQTIETALLRREALRKTVPSDLRSLEEQSNSAGAVGALLLGDGARERMILYDSKNAEAQKTLLRYARQTREKLPIRDVANLLGSNDSGVAGAAEKYLETEDSSEARRLYLTRHKGEALILGLRTNVDPGHFSFTAFDELEDQLRRQVKGETGAEIYGLLTAGYWGNAGQILIRKSGGAAELRFIEDPARYYSRSLSRGELSELEQLVRDQKVDDLGFLDSGVSDGMQYEYIHVTKDGGRRVFMNNPGFQGGDEYARVCAFFINLARASHLTLHYRESASMPGFEVLLADPRAVVGTVWTRGGNLRLMAVFPEKSRTYTAIEDNGQWHLDGTLRPANTTGWLEWLNQRLAPCEKPGDFPDTNPNQVVPEQIEKDLRDIRGDDPLWRLTVGGKTYRVAVLNELGGLWEFSNGMKPRLVRAGDFLWPVLTPDGRFAFVAEHRGDSWAELNFVSRIDLQTGAKTRLNLAAADRTRPIVYAAARNGVLVVRWSEGATENRAPLGPGTPEYWLVNPRNGETRRVEGEFSPFDDETHRPLQAAGGNFVWAAVVAGKENATRVGRYDLRSFRLSEVLRVPGLQFRSDSIWVDEAAGKLYVCYRGQLLRMDIGRSE